MCSGILCFRITKNSPDKVCCPFPQRWTSAGCNIARLQVSQGHQRQHSSQSREIQYLHGAQPREPLLGLSSFPRAQAMPGQHSPGSPSLLMGSSAHGVCFPISNPRMCVSEWILRGFAHQEYNSQRQQLSTSWVIHRKLWIEVWKEHSTMPPHLWLSGGLRRAPVPPAELTAAAPAPSSSSSRFQTRIC